MRRDYRKKASEVFTDTAYVFAKKSRFADSFPQLASMTIRLERTGEASLSGIP